MKIFHLDHHDYAGSMIGTTLAISLPDLFSWGEKWLFAIVTSLSVTAISHVARFAFQHLTKGEKK